MYLGGTKIYTEKINSVQHVLSKYFATVFPLMLLSFCYMFFAAGCFYYWEYWKACISKEPDISPAGFFKAYTSKRQGQTDYGRRGTGQGKADAPGRGHHHLPQEFPCRCRTGKDHSRTSRDDV